MDLENLCVKWGIGEKLATENTEATEGNRGLLVGRLSGILGQRYLVALLQLTLSASVSYVVNFQFLVQKSTANVFIALDAPIAKERPVATYFIDLAKIYFGAKDLFSIV